MCSAQGIKVGLRDLDLRVQQRAINVNGDETDGALHKSILTAGKTQSSASAFLAGILGQRPPAVRPKVESLPWTLSKVTCSPLWNGKSGDVLAVNVHQVSGGRQAPNGMESPTTRWIVGSPTAVALCIVCHFIPSAFVEVYGKPHAVNVGALLCRHRQRSKSVRIARWASPHRSTTLRGKRTNDKADKARHSPNFSRPQGKANWAPC